MGHGAQTISKQFITAILPAYNEEGRIGDVLHVVTQASFIDEIIVVCDGCTDNTAAEAKRALRFAKQKEHLTYSVLELERNIGKGGAMLYGAQRTNADVLLFLDADLIGLTPSHVDALIKPMLCNPNYSAAAMTLGIFGAPRGGIFGKWLGICHRTAANLTGQRAIRRDLFLGIPNLYNSRFGVEMAITHYIRDVWQLRMQHVSLDGVTHPIKEEKTGIWRGTQHRFGMYEDIISYILYNAIRARISTIYNKRKLRIKKRRLVK